MGRKKTSVINSVSNSFILGLFLSYLIVADYALAGCVWDLKFGNRKLRDNETENRAINYINEFTANQTVYLLSATTPTPQNFTSNLANCTIENLTRNSSTPPFNLTSKLALYVGEYRRLADFVLTGGLYNVSWDNLSSGYLLFVLKLGTNGSNNSQLSNQTCQEVQELLSQYLKNNYSQSIETYLTQFATDTSHPLGVYRPKLKRIYNYSTYDDLIHFKSLCQRLLDEKDYFYSITFSVYQTDFSSLLSTEFLPSPNTSKFWYGNLLMTDLELALDNFTSYFFDSTYIQSSFETWQENSQRYSQANWLVFTFKMTLFFNKFFSTFEINSKLENMKFLQLRYLKINLPLSHSWMPYVFTGGSYYNSYMGGSTRTQYYSSSSQSVQFNIFNNSLNGGGMTSDTSTQTTANQSSLAEHFTTDTQGSNSPYSNIQTESSPYPASPSPTSLKTNTEIETGTSLFQSSVVTSEISSLSTDDSTLQLSTVQITGSIPAIANLNLTSTKYPSTMTLQIPQTKTSVNINFNGTDGSTTIPSTTLSTEKTPVTSANLTSLNTPGQNTTLNNYSMASLSTTVPVNTPELSSVPYDEEQWFIPEVPVIPKIYNDKFLLRHIGKENPVTDHSYFYTITIPTALGIIVSFGFCLALWQIDWIDLAAPRKNIV